MRALYISIQARFLSTLSALLVLSVIILCVALWIMTGRILVDMKMVNLDIESRRVLVEVERRLSSMFTTMYQLSITAQVQNVTMGLPTSLSSEDIQFLLWGVTTYNISEIKIYGPELDTISKTVFNATVVTGPNADTLYPIEDEADRRVAISKLTTKGMICSVPLLSVQANVSVYVMSMTIPIVLSSSLNTVITSPYDLANKANSPTIGFFTVVFTVSKAGPLELDHELFLALGKFVPNGVTVVAPLGANLLNVGIRGFQIGRNITLNPDTWSGMYANKTPETHRASDSGIISIAPLQSPYDDLTVILCQGASVLRQSRTPLMNALIIAATVSCFVGFVVLFLLNRWRTRNLVNLIKATGKRKRAMDESRKAIQSDDNGPKPNPLPEKEEPSGTHSITHSAVENIVGSTEDGGEPVESTKESKPTTISEPSSTTTLEDFYGLKAKDKSGLWPWVRRTKAGRANIDRESGPQTLVSDQYKERRLKLPMHINDEAVDMSIGIDSIFEALIRQHKVLEERVLVRKAEIAEAKQNADEANAAKSHFLARVTHELRTPLNGILGTASLCADEKDLMQIHTSLKTIYKCGELLLHLLTDLLSFSQSESENVELDEQELMIEEITTQIIAIFRDQTAKNNIKLDIQIDPECERQIVYGDINRILQVIFNLLSNSIKFTPDGGHIEFIVFAKPIENDTKRLVSCIVRDNGPGIAPHLQSRVFEAFVQGDINSKIRKAGVGLGLSICKQLAQRMGGSITLKSELGNGAEFTFTVPLRYVGQAQNDSSSSLSKDANIWPEYEHYNTSTIMRKAEAELGVSRKHGSSTSSITPSSGHNSFDFHRNNSSSAPSLDERAEQSSGSEKGSIRPPLNRGISVRGSTVNPNLRVLVADDNKVNQEVMTRMLNLEGLHDITVADDGLEAIEKTKSSKENSTLFDIIFMDVQMPNCDGKRATQILRELDIQIPIIAVSAYASEENVEACIEAGMNLFLGKPLRRPSLHKLLEGLQDSELFEAVVE